MATLPAGTVTFVFTDIEGSTALLRDLGERYADVVRDHRRIVRDRFGAAGGTEVDSQGDAFFFSFPRARDAVRAAAEAQRELEAYEWPDGARVRVRMGLHTGEPSMGDEGYLGLDVVRAARICAAGHGGQILLSETTRALVGDAIPAGTHVVDLGRQALKDVQEEHLFQLSLAGQPDRFPALKTLDEPEGPEELAQKIQRRVNEYVAQTVERSLSAEPPASSAGDARTTAFELLQLVLVVGAVVVITLLLRLLF